MRSVKDEFKHLDSMFREEAELTNSPSLAVILSGYRTAELENPKAFELARRRYRKHEHRLTTCRQMFISESNYYRTLGAFLKIAQDEQERLARTS